MKTKSIPSPWLHKEGRRLDCGPYFSGGLEARLILEGLDCPKARLCDLTAGHKGGIFNGPKFSRTWVTDPKHGVPFLGSASMLRADLSDLPFLRNKDAYSNKLSYLRIQPGMSLISCSGTIGRMVYARPDMAGMWSSQHIMKVVADESKILPGYLYAFLSSKFGIPQVMTGVHGAIIQSLQPENIADVLVPRLGEKIERQVHDLVQQAAEKRSYGIKCLCRARTLVDEYCGFERPTPKLNITDIPSTAFQHRADGDHYRVESLHAERTLSRLDTRPLGESCEVTLPPISSRVRGSEEGGYPYFTGPALYSWNPDQKGYLARRSPKVETMILHRECVLIQAFGQRNGIICAPTWAGRDLVGTAVSGLMLRVESEDLEWLAFVFAFLGSALGLSYAIRLPYGGSIPHVSEKQYNCIPVPVLKQSHVDHVVELTKIFIEARNEGFVLEQSARLLVESSISEGAD